MSGEWQDISTSCHSVLLMEFLESKGLVKHAQKIIEVSDAETIEDLKLIDGNMMEEVIQEAGLKLVSAQKLRLAIAELREDSPGSTVAHPTDGSPASLAAGAYPAVLVSPDVQMDKTPDECIAVCIDRSGSMGAPFSEVTLSQGQSPGQVVKGTTRDAIQERSRMEAVKVMFYAFRDRAATMGQGFHHMGLISFDNRVEKMLDLTSQLDRFEAIVDDLEKRGQTAIYSAVIEAAEMLEKQFHKDSQMDLRIVVLTDGQNNTGAGPEDALAAANRIGATVDAIIVGNSPDANLRKIVNATGGECYQINDLGEGFELLEAEGVVSLRARRGGAEKPPFKVRELDCDFSSLSEKAMTRGAAVQRAPTLAPELAAKAVVDVSSIQDDTTSGAGRNGSNSLKRVMKEIKQVASGADGIWMHSGEGIHVFPASDDLAFWRVLIEGPGDSPFEGGVFALNVVIPHDYPFKAPTITFETPIYHCNVSDSGKICLDILQDKWNPALSIPKCLEAIRMMMQKPDTDNALRQWIAELTLAHQQYGAADTRYYEKARESNSQHASLSLDGWKQKWGC
jgi:ubiquitin-conjugating enzyme E2 D/E